MIKAIIGIGVALVWITFFALVKAAGMAVGVATGTKAAGGAVRAAGRGVYPQRSCD